MQKFYIIFKNIKFLALFSLFTGCLQFSSPTLENPSKNPQSKSASNKKVIHNFTSKKTITIPQEMINNEKLSMVIIENSDKSFRMIIDKEELKYKNTFDVPVAKLNEKIGPVYIFK